MGLKSAEEKGERLKKPRGIKDTKETRPFTHMRTGAYEFTEIGSIVFTGLSQLV